MAELAASTFRPLLNSIFEIRHRLGAATALTLVDITEPPPAPGLEQFSLIFHGPPGGALGQGTHRSEHPDTGPLDLFITPITGSGEERMVYEACFSRIVRDR